MRCRTVSQAPRRRVSGPFHAGGPLRPIAAPRTRPRKAPAFAIVAGLATLCFFPPAGAALAGQLPSEEVVLQLRRARIAGECGQTDRQRRILEEVARENPDEIPAVLALMEFYRSLPSSSAEARSARRTLRRLLLDTEREAHVALLQRFAIDPDASDDDLELIREMLAARAAREEDPATLRLLGALHEYFGHYEEARAAFGRALDLDPDPTVLGRCLSLDMELGRWKDALGLLRSGRAAAGNDLWRYTAVRIFSGLGRVEELDAELEAILREETYLPRVVLPDVIAAGFHLYDDGRTAHAERLFRHLASVFPEDLDLSTIIAHLFAGEKEMSARSAQIDDLWRRQGDAVALVNEGAARLSAGDAASALEILKRATALLPDSDLAWFNLGLAAERLERWPEAEAAFESAVSLNPRFAKAVARRGIARLRLGRIPEACADGKRALELQPGLQQARYLLRLCEKTMEDEATAGERLRRDRPP